MSVVKGFLYGDKQQYVMMAQLLS